MWRIKNIITYILTVILFFCVYIYLGSNYIFLFLLCLFILSFLLMRYTVKHITCQLEKRMLQAGKGVEQQIKIQLQNPTWVPVLYVKIQITVKNIFYKQEKIIEVKCNIPAKSRKEMNIPITIYQSGCIEIVLSDIVVRDWLQLFEKQINLSEKEEWMIFPNMEEEDELQFLFSGSNEEEKQNLMRSSQKSDSIAAIREYMDGDRMQRIHWKLSAKKNSILVKDYECLSKEGIKIVIELYENEKGSLDACIDMVYNFIRFLLETQQPAKLIWWSEQQNSFQEQYIVNEETFITAMCALFYEILYPERNKAYLMMKQTGQAYLYVQPYDEITGYYGEKCYIYKNKVVLAKVF